MASRRAEIVGRVVADLVREEMRKAKGTPFIRLQHFDRDEISVFVGLLSSFSLRPSLPRIQIVVATRTVWDGLPADVVLAPGDTLTKHRNNNKHGLLIVEYEPQADAQGLRNMRVITDREVLGLAGSEADLHKGRRRQLLVEAWRAYQPKGVELPAPDALARQTDQVFAAVASSVALRRWVEFLEAACEPLAASAEASDANASGATVGGSLACLGLFPDPDLFAGSDAERKRRLTRNVFFSRLQNAAGRDVNPDDLIRRIDAVTFRGGAGELLEPRENDRVREAAKAIVDPSRPRDFRTVTYAQWLQLFASDTKREGLGAAVRKRIAAQDSSRLVEFEALDVEAGLDQEDPEAAETLLKAPGDPPLTVLLPEALVRRIEKVAAPSGRSAPDPLRELLKLLQGVREDATVPEGSTILLSIEHNDPRAEQTSVALFRLLYGPTLEELAAGTKDGLGWHFGVQGLGHRPLAFPVDTPDKDDEESELDPRDLWAPLKLVVKAVLSQGKPKDIGRFEWRPLEHPGYIAFARLVTSPEQCAFAPSETLDGWLRAALTSVLPGAFSPVVGGSDGNESAAARWIQARAETLRALLSDGVRASRVDEYVRQWSELLEEVRRAHVPQGAPEEELAAFLKVDSLKLRDGRFALTATHPLRMRWLHAHIDKMGQKLATVLDREDGLVLNEINRDLYFDRIEQLSPHQHPPFVCLDGSTLAVATREVDWFEEYAAIRRERAPARDWLSSVDDASVEEMAGVVRSYVDAYPHKRDGLSLVVFLRDGDTRVIERLISRVRHREYSDISLEVHVYASPEHHHAIAQALAGFDSEEERGASFMPAVQSVLHAWTDLETAPDTTPLENRIDLALVPNLFGTTAFAQEKTRADMSQPGRFDPWMDRTTHADTSTTTASNENVSRVLLPHDPDPLLETWSTLSVWNIRNEPVGAGGERSVDYVTVQVRFDMSRKFFSDLHRVAHWVVTLDPFIGREQIEALREQPDIITVRPGVGKNEAYTLIVSSSSGRKFVERKLALKLIRDLSIVSDEAEATAIAKMLYAKSRHLAPGVLLRALGLGQTVQEIIGLLVARYALEELERDGAGLKFEAWISLDEHAEWFGGPQSVRADLLRIRGRRREGRLMIEAHVLEAKFREREEVSRAEQQVERTIKLVRQALASTAAETKFDDGVFWRREVLRAIQQGCKRPESGDDYAALRVWRDDRSLGADLDPQDRADFREGNYDLETVTGTICGITYGLEAPEGRISQRNVFIRSIRIGTRDLKRILGELTKPAPTASTSTASPPEAVAPVNASSPTVTQPIAVEDSIRRAAIAEPALVAVDETSSASAVKPVSVRPARRGLGEEGLQIRYQQVLDAFDEFGVRVSRPATDRFSEGPGFYIVRVVPEKGVSPDVVMARLQELKLKLSLNAEQIPRTYIDRGAIVFEIPKQDDERYPVYAEDVWERVTWPKDKLLAPIGEDVTGAPVSIEFSSSDSPHLLIAGTTGSGKSVALESLLRGLAHAYDPSALEFAMVDPKGTELIEFESDPHMRGPLGMGAEDAKAFLEEAVEEMQRRYEKFRAARVRDLPSYNATGAERIPWRLVVLDEYADLTSDKDDRKVIEDQLKRLAQKARACGIHVIIATQKPSAVVLNTTIRSNLPAQLALRVKTSTDSRIIMDEAGAETLAGKGDAFLRTAKNITRIQCAMRRPRPQ